MNLAQLRYFVELAHTRHYTKAAQRLYITQPSLSHAIGQLEEELGVPLFEKSGRNTTLTSFGQQFLCCVESSLSTLDEGVEAMRRAARGEGVIRLGLLRTLGVDLIPELAAGFLREHPGERIQFTFGTGVTQSLLDGLLAQQYDLVFSSRPGVELGLRAVKVGRQDLVLIVPRGHPLSGRGAVDLGETLDYPYVYFSAGSGLRGVLDGLFQSVGERPKIAYEVEEDQVVAGLVARGFGIGVVPHMELLSHLEVEVLQIVRPAWERNFYMISNERIFVPPVVRRFQQFVLERAGEQQK